MGLQINKYSANGNDFIILENSNLSREEIIQITHRNFGIGADGLLVISSTDKCDFKINMFNCDGSTANMCSNGVRSCLHFFHHHIVDSKTGEYKFELAGKIYQGLVDSDISTLILDESNTSFEIVTDLPFKHEFRSCGFVNTGVEHLCLEVEDIENLKVNSLGSYYRHHEFFQNGTNVNFFQLKNDQVFIRTFERGVEAETLSCGSGILATAVFLNSKEEKSLREFKSKGGDSIVRYSDLGYEYEGKVHHVFSGEYLL